MIRPAYLVSHTHWDREWYRTFQQFRLDLVRTLDGILDTLESDPHFVHFLLDGQTIVIDDYLAMRPERGEQLRRHIASGRLAVGPWYCHPDLFLVSGEALVRNLLIGLTTARSWGRALMVGYVPDQFGHTGQLPQIFAGFGIDTAVLWRGVNARETRNESWWDGRDGTRLRLELLAQTYGNAQQLPLDPAALAARLRQLCAVIAAGATGPGVLLMNGHDHLPIQAGLPAALAEANALLAPDWRVEQTSLDDAVTRLHREGRPEGVLHGELRSPATAHLLPGVLSTRIPLKRRNAAMQTLIEREAEPYAAWASLLDARYPQGELWEAWRLLLQNHPHDSICGCSIDQVHREMEIRYDAVEQIGEELVARALDHLAARIDTRPPAGGLAEGAPTHTVALVVFNPSSQARSERVRVTLELPGMTAGYTLLDAAGEPVPHRWTAAGGEPSTLMPVPRDIIPTPEVLISQLEGNRAMGMGLQHVALRTANDGLHVEVTAGDSGILSREEVEAHIWNIDRVLRATDPAPVMLHIHHNARHELEFLARHIPAHGYATLWLCPLDDATLDAPGAAATNPRPTTTAPDRQTIENNLFRVSADPLSGALTLTDRRTGTTYGPLHRFVDSGDAGDSYTYTPPASDTVIDRPAAAPLVEAIADPLGATLRVVQDLAVPRGLTEDRAARSRTTLPIRITSAITLTDDCPRVDIATTVDNTATDHRLRVTFTVPFATDHVHAEQAFDVVERPLEPMAIEGTVLEDAVRDAPQQSFVVLHDGARGLVVANTGLPEYEASSDGAATTLSLTLLRCVGWLSRDDLPTRRGGAGPSLTVPAAQCPGPHTFTYSLIPLAGDWRGAIGMAHQATVGLRTVAAAPSAGSLPGATSFMEIDAPGIVVSAVKRAEDGRGLVVRLYNSADTQGQGLLRLFRTASVVERLHLDERRIDTLHSAGPLSALPLSIGPHRIETLRLVFAQLSAVSSQQEDKAGLSTGRST